MLPWIIIGAALVLFFWNRSASAAQPQLPYHGQNITIGPGSPTAITARVKDVISIVGYAASQVAVTMGPGMLRPIAAGPSNVAADWGVLAPGTAYFAFPDGTGTQVNVTS
jgi:hypothetical protein